MRSNNNSRTLVLNRLWQPVNIIGIERAFSLLLQDHAQAIYTSDGSFRMMDSSAWLNLSSAEDSQNNEPYVQTVRLRIRVPKVLLLRKYDKLPAQEVSLLVIIYLIEMTIDASIAEYVLILPI